jgi:hypothetical protein
MQGRILGVSGLGKTSICFRLLMLLKDERGLAVCERASTIFGMLRVINLGAAKSQKEDEMPLNLGYH